MELDQETSLHVFLLLLSEVIIDNKFSTKNVPRESTTKLSRNPLSNYSCDPWRE